MTVVLPKLKPTYQLPWNGQPLTGRFLAFDSETTIVELDREVPELVLATATDGHTDVVIHPDQIGDFVLRHADVAHGWSGFNWAFDFWVVHNHLVKTGEKTALSNWWSLADNNGLHDLMLLDMLVRLGRPLRIVKGFNGQETVEGLDLQPRTLDAVAWDYLKIRVPKDSPYRVRFGEIQGKDWRFVDQGFFNYAVHDTRATYQLRTPLERAARNVLEKSGLRIGTKHHDIRGDSLEKYGWLTVHVQTKAAIALSDITRRGIGVDRRHAKDVESRLRTEVDSEVVWLHLQHPGLFKSFREKKRSGQLKRSKVSNLPCVNQSYLMGVLSEIEKEEGILAPRSEKKDQITTSMEFWKEYEHRHQFLHHMKKLQDGSKTLQFVSKLDTDVLHPHYRTLVRTGRTSSSGPNIQNFPRTPWFRQLFVPRPGYKLVAVDYSAIELRTLAVTCLAKYGHSTLAEVLRKDIDPHAYTAAMFTGLTYDQFMELKKTDKERYDHLRQIAKPVNFGVPGGLGAVKLRGYAKNTYGVVLSKEESEQFRSKLIREVYPELDHYLEDGILRSVAGAVNRDAGEEILSADDVKSFFSDFGVRFHPSESRKLERTLAGLDYRVDDKGNKVFYPDRFVRKVWSFMEKYFKNTTNQIIRHAIETRRGSQSLRREIFNSNVATLTGRVRSDVSYSEQRNTPFQGLAADGAKLALWELCKAGFRVVAFVHDEIVVEVRDEDEAQRVASIMTRVMEEVLEFPVQVAYKVADYWSKP